MGNTHGKCGNVWTCCSSAMSADRQTDRQTFSSQSGTEQQQVEPHRTSMCSHYTFKVLSHRIPHGTVWHGAVRRRNRCDRIFRRARAAKNGIGRIALSNCTLFAPRTIMNFAALYCGLSVGHNIIIPLMHTS